MKDNLNDNNGFITKNKDFLSHLKNVKDFKPNELFNGYVDTYNFKPDVFIHIPKKSKKGGIKYAR